MIWICILLCIVCSACIPAQTPPQLEFTPGAPVIVTDQIYQYETYQVAYPMGWRVITAAAESAGSVTLAAPDNQALVFISTHPIENPPALPGAESPHIETRQVSISDSVTIHATLVVDTAFQDTLLPLFEQIISSIEMPRLIIPTHQSRM